MHSDCNKAIFLDRDGVVNIERGEYTWLLEDFRLNDSLIPFLLALQAHAYQFFIISNQGGIGKNLYTKQDVDYLHLHLSRKLMAAGISISEIYYCPHHPDSGLCLCRKPDSLLLEKAIARFNINAKSSWFIGDAERDELAAAKAGLPSIRVQPNSSLMPLLEKILS